MAWNYHNSPDSFDERHCKCSEPPYKPPCSYCESGETMEYEDTCYVENVWKTKYYQAVEHHDNILEKFREYKKKAEQNLRDIVYKETLEEMEAYARSEVIANLEDELREQVYAEQYLNIKQRIEEQARADILAEARKQVFEELAKANERI